MQIVMYANRDNSTNHGSLLQKETSMSDREMSGSADDMSVFFLLQEEEVGETKECRPLTLNFDAKKFPK